MALLSEINRQKIKMYEQEMIKVTNDYNRLMNENNRLIKEHNDALDEIRSLKRELDFFHRETRKHKYDWESMFYTNNDNINGYAFELEKIEERKRSNSL
jgi:predicted RNase H-like nuclease (RuvC/YqgF family)